MRAEPKILIYERIQNLHMGRLGHAWAESPRWFSEYHFSWFFWKHTRKTAPDLPTSYGRTQQENWHATQKHKKLRWQHATRKIPVRGTLSFGCGVSVCRSRQPLGGFHVHQERMFARSPTKIRQDPVISNLPRDCQWVREWVHIYWICWCDCLCTPRMCA